MIGEGRDEVAVAVSSAVIIRCSTFGLLASETEIAQHPSNQTSFFFFTVNLYLIKISHIDVLIYF